MIKNLDLLKKVMKLNICLLILSVHVSAAVFSQKITLNVKNGNLESVIKKIEKQSGYSFVYKIELLRQNPAPISVTLKDATLDEALKESLKDQSLTYVIIYKTVVINPKPVVSIKQDIAALKRTLHGKVTDNNNHPIAGVTVRVDGTDLVAMTDNNGNYTFDLVPATYSLVFSSIGYESQIIKKVLSSDGDDQLLNVVLSVKISMLQQSLVVGYTTKKTDEITGALQSFSAGQLEGVTSNNFISDLKGKVAGMYITDPSGDPNAKPSFVVRGQGTFPITNDPRVVNNLNPLVVIDGIIYSDIANPSDIVSTTDIETITLLRDAASTAIYGSRASQGVIVITTKKGVAGKSKVDVNSTFGVSERYLGKLKFMNSQQLYNYQQQMLINSYAVNSESLSLGAYLAKYLPNASVLGTNTNWNNLTYRNGLTKTIDAALSGGDEITRYYFGANNYNEDGALRGSDLSRTSVKLNVDHNVNKNFIISASLSAIFDKGDSSPIGSGSTTLPWYTPYNPDGSPKKILGTDVLGNTTTNPLYDLPYNNSTTTTQQLLGVFSAKYKITNWLSASSNNSYNTTYVDAETYDDPLSVAGAATKGSLIQRKSDANSFLTSNLLTAKTHFGLHNIGGLGGFEYNHSNSEYNDLAVQNLPSGIKVPSAAAAPYNIFNGNAYQGEKYTRGYYSNFAEADYNYDERYYFNSSYRMDYSDNFGLDNRAGHFYSVSGAWLLSHENFLKGDKAITNLKLRGSYGTTGKVAGEDFLTESFYNFGYQYGSNPAAVINQLGNNSITWEKAYTLNGGLDLTLFNRVTLNVDVYRKRTTGLLQDVQVSALLGVPNQYQNIGQMVNHGVELQLTSQNLVGKFKWQTQFNISFNQNKVEKLGAQVLGINGNLQVGDDIAAVHQVKWLGVNPQTGQPQFERLTFDANNNITGRQVVNSYNAVFAGLSGAASAGQFQKIGNTTPKYFGGIANTFSYNRFDLSILLNFAEGYLVYNNQRSTYFSSEGNNVLQYNQVLPAAGQVIWQKPGDMATDPQPIRNRTDGANQETSRFWEDASNIRVRNIRLSYSLPESLTNKIKVKKIKVFLSGDDLFVFTRKSFYGVDPEGGLGGDDYSYGIGAGYGASRKYLMGLQLSFN